MGDRFRDHHEVAWRRHRAVVQRALVIQRERGACERRVFERVGRLRPTRHPNVLRVSAVVQAPAAERASGQPRLTAAARHVVHPDRPRAGAEMGAGVRLATSQAELATHHFRIVRDEPVVAHGTPRPVVVDLHPSFSGRAPIDETDIALGHVVRDRRAVGRRRRPVTRTFGIRRAYAYLVGSVRHEMLDAGCGRRTHMRRVLPVPPARAVLHVVVRDRRAVGVRRRPLHRQPGRACRQGRCRRRIGHPASVRLDAAADQSLEPSAFVARTRTSYAVSATRCSMRVVVAVPTCVAFCQFPPLVRYCTS